MADILDCVKMWSDHQQHRKMDMGLNGCLTKHAVDLKWPAYYGAHDHHPWDFLGGLVSDTQLQGRLARWRAGAQWLALWCPVLEETSNQHGTIHRHTHPEDVDKQMMLVNTKREGHIGCSLQLWKECQRAILSYLLMTNYRNPSDMWCDWFFMFVAKDP